MNDQKNLNLSLLRARAKEDVKANGIKMHEALKKQAELFGFPTWEACLNAQGNLNPKESQQKVPENEPQQEWEICFKHTDKTDLFVPSHPQDHIHNQEKPFLIVDFEKMEIDTTTRGSSETGWPSREFHDLQKSFALPYNVDALELKNWVLNELIPEELNDLHSKFEVTWNGNNYVGKFGEDHESEIEQFFELESFIEKNAPTLGDDWLGVIDARYWFEGFDWSKISVNTSNSELEKLAEEEENEANDRGKVRDCFFSYLETKRDEKIEELLRNCEKFFILPKNQGQIVEISHAIDYIDDRVIEKRYDKSDKTTKYYAYKWVWDSECEFNHLSDELKLGEEIDICNQ